MIRGSTLALTLQSYFITATVFGSVGQLNIDSSPNHQLLASSPYPSQHKVSCPIDFFCIRLSIVKPCLCSHFFLTSAWLLVSRKKKTQTLESLNCPHKMNPHSFQSIKLQCELYVLISYHIKCISIFYCDFFSPDL